MKRWSETTNYVGLSIDEYDSLDEKPDILYAYFGDHHIKVDEFISIREGKLYLSSLSNGIVSFDRDEEQYILMLHWIRYELGNDVMLVYEEE